MTVAELYERIGGDYEAAKRILMMDPMIAKFIAKLPNDHTYDQLKAAGENLDPAGLFTAAHTLKGLAANLGLVKLSVLAGTLTEEFRPGKERTLGDDQVREILGEIGTLYEGTLDGIRAFQEG